VLFCNLYLQQHLVCVWIALCDNTIKSVVQTLWHCLCQTVPVLLCYSYMCYMLYIATDHCLWFFYSVICVGSFSFAACVSILSNKFHSTSDPHSTYRFHLLPHTNFFILFYSVIASCFTYIYLKSGLIISSVYLFKKVAAGKWRVDEGWKSAQYWYHGRKTNFWYRWRFWNSVF
jgi:hypothetical protein